MSEFSRRAFLRFTGAAGAVATGALPAACAASGQGGRDPAPELADLRPMTSGLPPMPADAHARRQESLQAALAERGAGAFFAGPTLNLTYFTGKSWGASERLFGCLFLPGSRVWIAPKFEELRAREVVGADELRTWEEWQDPHELLWNIARERGLRGPLALDPHMRATHASRLAALASARGRGGAVVDGLPHVGAVRSVKTEPELARIRRACEITKKAIAAVLERLVRPGISESDASAWVQDAQRRLGLTNTWALVLFGPNAAFPHGTRERRPLESQQFALFDCGGELESYQSDITRTYFIGDRPTPRQATVYRAVQNAQIAALHAAKPGVACEDVDAAARAVVATAGFGAGFEYFTHRLGHGIGLEGHEDPYFCKGNRTILRPGMTLSNEPGIYVPGELGVRLEDIVTITEHGAEILGGTLSDDIGPC
jgi:Xaa-Pro dipeptidase